MPYVYSHSKQLNADFVQHTWNAFHLSFSIVCRVLYISLLHYLMKIILELSSLYGLCFSSLFTTYVLTIQNIRLHTWPYFPCLNAEYLRKATTKTARHIISTGIHLLHFHDILQANFTLLQIHCNIFNSSTQVIFHSDVNRLAYQEKEKKKLYFCDISMAIWWS